MENNKKSQSMGPTFVLIVPIHWYHTKMKYLRSQEAPEHHKGKQYVSHMTTEPVRCNIYMINQ